TPAPSTSSRHARPVRSSSGTVSGRVGCFRCIGFTARVAADPLQGVQRNGTGATPGDARGYGAGPGFIAALPHTPSRQRFPPPTEEQVRAQARGDRPPAESIGLEPIRITPESL